MDATVAPSPWPAPAASGPTATPSPVEPPLRRWRFGRELYPAGAAVPAGLQWLLKRNCSIGPRQLLGAYLLLCAASGAISLFFLSQGVVAVAGFAGLELFAVGVAMLVFARHAGDRETLTLVGRSLHVEQCSGSRTARTDFSADWLTVEPAAGQNSLVQIAGQGQVVQVGRFLRPELRADFARELRLALRAAT